MQPLDGNALAGPLGELFRFDLTTTEGECRHCRDSAVLARAVVYPDPSGYVVRCRACGEVLLVHSAERTWLDLSGIAGLRIVGVARATRAAALCEDCAMTTHPSSLPARPGPFDPSNLDYASLKAHVSRAELRRFMHRTKENVWAEIAEHRHAQRAFGRFCGLSVAGMAADIGHRHLSRVRILCR